MYAQYQTKIYVTVSLVVSWQIFNEPAFEPLHLHQGSAFIFDNEKHEKIWLAPNQNNMLASTSKLC